MPRTSVQEIFSQPPRGHYTLSEAAWLAGVTSRRLSGWAKRGYVPASQSTSPLVFCFQDVAEAMLVHELLVRAVPWKTIRSWIEDLWSEGRSWPLSTESGLVTLKDPHAARSSMASVKDGLVYSRQGVAWQAMLNPATLGLVMDRLRRGGWAVVEEPSIKHIAVDPDWLSGRPTIVGRRIAAVDVANLAADPSGRKILQRRYQLKPAEINDAVRWWRAAQRPAA